MGRFMIESWPPKRPFFCGCALRWAKGTQSSMSLSNFLRRRLLFFFLLVMGSLIFFSSCRKTSPGNPKVPPGAKSSGGLHAHLETSRGIVEIELFEHEAPRAVENFRLLAQYGYYNGLTFHRIVKGFMVQGGDPNGDGTGGESAWGGTFEDEISPSSPLYQRGYRRGIVAMANSGPNTNGSQFFIMHQDYSLPPNYVIFGGVVRGMDVVDALAETPTALGADGNMSKPLSRVAINKISIQP
jgi:cyclophilin family peptidyl-prolyl cis-trans isomerase